MLATQVLSGGSLQLICLICGETFVLVPTVRSDDMVSDLKKSIQGEREKDTLKDVGPHTLELWKVSTIYGPLCEMT